MSKFLNFFDRVYLINLDSRKDRLQKVSSRFSLLDIPFERFPAIKKDTADGFPSIGHHGCILSHVEILKHATEEGLENVLIFEDDVILRDDFKIQAPLAVEQLKAFPDWEMFFFGCHLWRSKQEKVASNLMCIDRPGHTHAYAVNLKNRALEVLLNGIQTRQAVDIAYHNSNLICYHSLPLLAVQEPNFSDIDGSMNANRQSDFYLDMEEFSANSKEWRNIRERLSI